MNDLRASHKTAEQESKEKKKAEKIAAMLAGLDAVSSAARHLFQGYY